MSGEVDGQCPRAVVGQPTGLLRPDRPVHAGPVEEHDQWGVGDLVAVYGHGTGGGVDGAPVDGELHGSAP